MITLKQTKKNVAPNTPVIGIMGPFGFGNLGDAAIQQAMIQHLCDRFPQAQIFGFSLNPEDTEKRHNIKSYPVGRIASFGWAGRSSGKSSFERFSLFVNRSRNGPNKYLRAILRLFVVPLEIISIVEASRWLKGMNAFIVSGGGQLDDYWGGPWHHPYTLFIWAVLAKFRGVKYKVVSVGKGSLDSALSRWYVRQALRLASYRSYRDFETKEFVNQIGFSNNDPVNTDLAYSLMIDSRPDTTESHFRGTIGIGPMAYYDPRVWPKKDIRVYQDYLTKLSAFAIWLLEQNFAIRLFPGEAIHDHQVIQDFLMLLTQSGYAIQPGQVTYEPVDTVDALMDQILRTDVVVASRFHGVLLSQLANKPVLALSYHSKVNVLMNETDQEEFCFPIDRFTVEAIKEKFQILWTNRGQIPAKVEQCIQHYRLTLNEQYETVFADI
jgi:polysaccharide pyruvyl transferase WcaK-like protein